MPRNATAVAARTRRGAFSMIELVIVIVIIGIIAAIAIPRMSKGSAAAADSAVKQNLGVLRSAVDLYHTEHNGTYPTAANIVAQLTQFTDVDGNVSATKTGVFTYGPYLRSVPTLSVGTRKGQSGIAAADAATVGWIYDVTTGNVSANAIGVTTDNSGALYSSY